MSNVVLHIGAPKTASTYLQDLLFSHGQFLRSELNIWVPEAGFFKGRGHIGFRQSLIKKLKTGDVEENRKQYRKAFKSKENVLISSELLWTVKPKVILNRYRELKKAKIFLYAREQHDLIISHYYQKIKTGDKRDLSTFFNEEKHQYDVSEKIQEYENVFGTGCVHVELYEEGSNCEQGIATHFFQSLSKILSLDREIIYEFTSGLTIPEKRSNRRVTNFTGASCLLINRADIPDEYKRILRAEFINNQDVVDKFVVQSKQSDDNFKTEVREYYKESNLRLFEKYFDSAEKYHSLWSSD